MNNAQETPTVLSENLIGKYVFLTEDPFEELTLREDLCLVKINDVKPLESMAGDMVFFSVVAGKIPSRIKEKLQPAISRLGYGIAIGFTEITKLSIATKTDVFLKEMNG